MKLKTFSKWFVIIGALEIGFIGVLRIDLIGSLIGRWPMIVTIVYALIGLSGIWGAYAMLTNKKKK
ncbi:MAG: DUF378 domain-containing protein [Candidatus Woesebacteria bacterium]|jgi:uncharacterized membrane protein YuzA (DUF378 family)|nr:DUF378 domain-containing protein [Candidatus Woesebacteria bacterium]